MAAGTPYAKRYAGGFFDGSGGGTPIDSTFLNAVEAALLQLLAVAPSADGQVMQWDNANTRYGPALLLNKNIDPAAAIASSKIDFTGANGVTDAMVKAAAAIAYSKLNLAGNIVNADISASAAIVGSKLLPSRVATTVAGLGTGADGATGIVVCGTTPFDMIAVVYNAALTKWVSQPFQGVVMISTGLSANNTANTWQGAANGPVFPYGAMLTAGFSLQMRLTMTLGPGTQTTDANVVLASAAAGAAMSANTADSVLITSTGAFVAMDSGWVAAPVPTAAACATATIRGRNTANNNGQWNNALVQLRWVA